MIVKDYITQMGSGTNKVHLRINGEDNGITGFYTNEELIQYFGDCSCEVVSYEKDYGDGAIAIRSFLAIYINRADRVIDDLIQIIRKK